MLIEQTSTAMDTNVNNASSALKINMDGFAFKALSGANLYKNVIRAVVRETACNAYDSHVTAGNKDEAFHIHLPTRIEPFFSIRDFGTGLDDAGVREVYLTFFGSTKRSDNRVIGAWGLGSKSPLGYSKNFTVNAYHNGVCRQYAVYEDGEGIPNIMLMTEGETTDRNGLEVIVPVVDINDMERFKAEAEDVLKWFPVKPMFNIEVNMGVGFGGDKLCDGIHMSKDYDVKIIHGFIEYPFSYMEAGIEHDRRIKGLIIEMPLGSVEFSMSREELAYTDKTKNAIGAMIDKANAVREQRYQELKESYACLWDFYNDVERMPFFNGIHKCFKSDHDQDYAHIVAYAYRSDMLRREFATNHLSPTGRGMFIINDLAKGSEYVRRVIKHNFPNYGDNINVLLPMGSKTLDELIASIVENFKMVPSSFKMLSSLQEPPRKAPASGKGKGTIREKKSFFSVQSVKVRRYTSRYKFVEIPEGDIDPCKIKYYVPMKKDSCVSLNGAEISAHQMHTIRECATNLGYIDNLYAVKTNAIKHLDSTWVNALELIKTMFEQETRPDKDIVTKDFDQHKKYLPIAGLLGFKELENYKDHVASFDVMMLCAIYPDARAALKAHNEKVDSSLKESMKKLGEAIDNLPMLKYISHWELEHDSTKADIEAYIKLKLGENV